MKVNERNVALRLRKQGCSLRQISEQLSISKSTASLWVAKTQLSDRAKRFLQETRTRARTKGLRTRRTKIEHVREQYYRTSLADFVQIKPTRENMRIGAALLYWGEGSKSEKYGMAFMNSEPELIRAFMTMLRGGFNIDESKLRACVHLHSYHDARKEIVFWSQITNISPAQFIKPYQKTNTGKHHKKEYHGCISIRYSSVEMVRELAMIKRAYIERLGV